jgi:methionyl-tRNA synthetase
MLYPIIPQSALRALKIFNINEKDINFTSVGDNNFLNKGDYIKKIDILFNKIEKKDD